MPPKTVKCFVCGNEVMKSQTLALKNGNRACRTHEGVEKESENLKQEEKERIAAEIKFRENKKNKAYYAIPTRNDIEKFRKHAETHCWTCGCEGMNQSEYNMEALVAMSRLELRGEFNLLTLAKDISDMLGNPRILYILPYEEKLDKNIYNNLKDQRLRDIIHFLRFFRICDECIKKFNLIERLASLLPKITPE